MYLDIFENGEFFLRFPKNTPPQVTYSNRLRPSTRNAKQWKYDSIPHRACVMLVVNDVLHVLHHRIRKPPFSSVHK